MATRHTIRRLIGAACAALALLPTAPGQVHVHRRGSSAQASQQAAGQDPGEIYLSAYRLCRESEMLAGKQSYNAALQKGREAEKILATIVRDYPNWKPNLVSARRRLLAENLANYRKQASTAAIPTGRQPGAPVSMEITRADLPGMPSDGLSEDYRPIPLPNYETTDKKLYHALARAQEECRRMAEAYRELNTRFKDVQKKLASAQIEQNMYKERYEKLLDQVTAERAAGNSVVDSLSRRLADMESKYRNSENALRDAEARASELETQLSETQASLEKVTRERDALYQENEKLRALVELNSPEKTKALLDQNITLAEQLKTAQERIKELEAQQSGANDQSEILAQQLEEARAEASRLRDEMSSIVDENMGYRKRISELTEQLNNLEADLNTRENQPPVDPALAEENKVLRGVIEKQRHTIAMQAESRRLLLETYQALKNNDPNVSDALRKLQEESSLDLTPAERQLLEDIRQNIAEADAGAKAVRRNLEIETLADLAEKAFSKGRYASAEQLYMTLYDIQPDHVAGLVNLGTILLHTNKSEQALEYLARAVRLAPDMALCYYLSGIAHYRLEHIADAQKMFTRAVQLDPGHAEAFFYLANIEGVSEAYERALKHYAAAVKIKPDLADAHYNMARIYAETGKIPEAARAYDRAVHNGAMPDPDFEDYLRQHPDNNKKPAPDLVDTIKPEEEARRLEEPTADPAAQAAAEPTPAQQKEARREQAKEEKLFAEFRDMVEKITSSIKAVSTASPAGSGHETDASRFSNIRMKTRLGLRPLRLKRAEPQRIRTRGEEDIQQLRKNARRGTR